MQNALIFMPLAGSVFYDQTNHTLDFLDVIEADDLDLYSASLAVLEIATTERGG